MKKFATVLAAVTAASLLLVGCGKSAEKEIEVDLENLPTYDELAAKTFEDAAYVSNLNLDELVELAEYKGIEVSVEKVHVDDADVESYIAEVLASNPLQVEVTDRAAQDGDTVVIDFVGLLDGEEFEGGSSDDYELVLGSDTFIDGFEDGVIGMEIGEEKDLELTFPDNYGSTDLAGKEVVFVVTLDKIIVEEEAELNDEWAAQLGVEGVSNVEELRTRVYEMYEEADQYRYDNEIANAVFNNVVENSKFKGDYFALKQRYFDTMLGNTIYQAESYSVDAAYLVSLYYQMEMADYVEELKNSADLTAKQSLAAEMIAKAEGIEVTQEDIDADMQVYADYYGYASLDAYKAAAGDMSENEDYMSYLLLDKVMTFLTEQAAVTETEPVEETETETETAE